MEQKAERNRGFGRTSFKKGIALKTRTLLAALLPLLTMLLCICILQAKKASAVKAADKNTNSITSSPQIKDDLTLTGGSALKVMAFSFPDASLTSAGSSVLNNVGASFASSAPVPVFSDLQSLGSQTMQNSFAPLL